MIENNIEKLLKNKVSWLADSGPAEDIAISSRIRLARNIEGVPFPIAASADNLQHSQSAVEMALEKSKSIGGNAFIFRMDAIEPIDKQLLLERRLISTEFVQKSKGASLALRGDESIAVMVNEEDHLRIQALRPGMQLQEVWDIINRLDNELERQLPYAYDSKLGFLTSCPTNVGTGMRASVMLHLPGLVLSGQINAAIQGVSKLGMAVRGIFGEGTDNRGNLFQVSNQSTLGESEEQIIERLDGVIKQMINHEKNARINLLENNQYFLLDHVGRSYGVLRHAYTLSSEEALNSLSGIRTGVDMGMFSSVDLHTVNELFLSINPAHLQRFAGKHLDSKERDVYRAALVRERLKNLNSDS
ncbi:protein arginine kinase [Lentisphaerota bacterium ZTH]|nr:protein arginine kinase [Lentisphaerota bacterium]WET07606.1 protein arginine kinase [Lentisphaerota bacterium ZTH]